MARFADVSGRYVYLELQGVEYRVYFEQAGSGIPLLCQHTAGADGRQWRHLLEDPEITSRFRVIAADLPYHGKSLPPTSLEWWKQEYALTQAFFMEYTVALAHALELEDPVFIGCSMGGHLAPDLALHHPDEFRAVIGVEAAMNSHGADGLMQWYFHPHISNTFKAEHMHTVCAPQSPEAYRRETGYLYSQGAPQAFKGDLAYYLVEHDVTHTAKEIDTSKVAVHILNGEYDYSAAPADGRELADAIEGATFVEMKGIGHFPMSENPEVFKRYLLPVLDQIESAQPARAAAR
ncbi:alpha/beta fold hydrolase [Conexibacter sp. CPCC 206217]|uniref:alpha/beta fold hydrolase n=1 Tax=Conexibacter sp. CPCC 206217 TaxID=3064574 RepID=UPI002719C19B|nr:alpha/beta hydrolase [Conexibacter sp. CPCC 206217]MDO8212220.1 alpha/beta hydrolase [Conexibacter sp. CPCC 206217]